MGLCWKHLTPMNPSRGDEPAMISKDQREELRANFGSGATEQCREEGLSRACP